MENNFPDYYESYDDPTTGDYDYHENSTLGNQTVEMVKPMKDITKHATNGWEYGGYGDDYDYENYDYSGSGYHYDKNYSYGNGIYPPHYEHKTFLYEGFDFERPIYTFIWEILVVLTTIVNIVVIVVLLRKRMCNVIHVVLVAIAISDSMTGLVTLPTYIYTYSHYEAVDQHTSPTYVLDKYWCNAFMISKFFLSKWFHNMSIWLTLFLGAQRFVSVLFPIKTQGIFTMRNTFLYVMVIFLLSPVLHIYHVIHMKANVEYGLCHWILDGDWSIVQLWVTLLLMHLIPCILLVFMTSLMIYRLFTALSKVTGGKGRNSSMVERRHDWNRRMSIIVSTIVIAFLIPELPYGIFLLITLTHVHSGNSIMPLIVNRGFHAGYEILLVLSFHANFWIYTVLNKRFRSELKKTGAELLYLVYRLAGKPVRKLSVTSTSFTGGKTAESSLSVKPGIKLKDLGARSSSDTRSERIPLKESSSGVGIDV